MLRRLCLFAALAAQFLFWNPAGVASVEAGIEYARVDGKPLLLDFYRLEGPVKGLVVYVHGGAWRGGSREYCPILGVLDA